MRDRKLGIIVLFFILISSFFQSCKTVEVPILESVILPSYNLDKPIRPVLHELDYAQLSIPAYKNMVLLMGYSKELEAYADGWIDFYEELRREYANNE